MKSNCLGECSLNAGIQASTEADMEGKRLRAVLAKLQGELMASAHAHIEELRIHAASREAEIARLQARMGKVR